MRDSSAGICERQSRNSSCVGTTSSARSTTLRGSGAKMLRWVSEESDTPPGGVAQLERKAPLTLRRRRRGWVARKLRGRGMTALCRVPGRWASTRKQNTSRRGAAVSRMRTQGVIAHEQAFRSRSCMWKRCCVSTSTGSSCGRRGVSEGKGGRVAAAQGSRGMLASQGSGSVSVTVIGDDLESASILDAHSRPKRRVMQDQRRGWSRATARQWRQTCATAGTHLSDVFLSVCRRSEEEGSPGGPVHSGM